MSGELLVIFIVALLVLGPKRLPMFAVHLSLLIRKITELKAQSVVFWQQQLKEYQLQENKHQAERADKKYNEL